jgi:hypothetical protein
MPNDVSGVAHVTCHAVEVTIDQNGTCCGDVPPSRAFGSFVRRDVDSARILRVVRKTYDRLMKPKHEAIRDIFRGFREN